MTGKPASPRAEERAIAADEKSQEGGPSLSKVARYARDYLRAVNPENGLDVVFKAGEMLPAWAPEED